MRNLFVRTITGVLYVAIIVVCFLKPLAMVFLFALVTGMAVWEFTGLINDRASVSVNRFITTVAGVYFFIATAGWSSGIIPTFAVFVPYLLTIVYLFISELYMKSADAVTDWAYTMLAQMYIALPLSTINLLAFTNPGDGSVVYSLLLPLSVFILLWTNDTGAFCFGSLFGRHRLFPRISPHKTWEGSIGGGLSAVVVAMVIGGWLAPQSELTIARWIGMAVVVVLFGTWGDLVESLFKRTLNIKDSGTILPGHGGILDRIDSSLMAFPAVVVYIYTLSLIK